MKQARIAQRRATMRPAGWLNRGAGRQGVVPSVPIPHSVLALMSADLTEDEALQGIGDSTFLFSVRCAGGTVVLTWRVN